MLKGRNLKTKTRPNVRLFQRITHNRVTWI